MAETTIIYYSCSTLAEPLAQLCRTYLVRAAAGIPIISVTQKPTELGQNICVGDIGRSLYSIFEQQIIGLNAARTCYAAFAEHDVIYAPGHFQFVPPQPDVFYYNTNFWYLNWGDREAGMRGQFSWDPKRQPYGEFKAPQSQLIVSRELALQAYSERLALIQNGYISRHLPVEPGLKRKSATLMLADASANTSSAEARETYAALIRWASKWRAAWFSVAVPNLDIQHTANWSRHRRVRAGGKIRMALPYWGTMDDVICNGQ
jgi:hypothetical protein